MTFPNSSITGLDGISPQVLEALTAKSNGQTRLNFLTALTNLVNVILEGKVPSNFGCTSFVRNWLRYKIPTNDFVL